MNLLKKSIDFRSKVINLETKKLLISKIRGSQQESDLTVPPNCNGFGRIRHFKRIIDERWIYDPLPIDPACKALKIDGSDSIQAQVFQLAICNLNCWYCFVPDSLNQGNASYSQWLDASEMLDLYQNEEIKPKVIDLSGGNPELAPEWVFWMIEEIQKRNLDKEIYLWSDDSLSTDFIKRYLSESQLERITNFKMYGKVGCFKGFDEESFCFNTGLSKDYFEEQLKNFDLNRKLNIDLYAYITLTTPQQDSNSIKKSIDEFFTKLQKIHPLLPLRVVPLKIIPFTPSQTRLNPVRERALCQQLIAIDIWKENLQKKYDLKTREMDIAEINILD